MVSKDKLVYNLIKKEFCQLTQNDTERLYFSTLILPHQTLLILCPVLTTGVFSHTVAILPFGNNPTLPEVIKSSLLKEEIHFFELYIVFKSISCSNVQSTSSSSSES